MPKSASIRKAREKKTLRPEPAARHEGFQPCSPDMTICGDCRDNRSKSKCPRLNEWLARQNR